MAGGGGVPPRCQIFSYSDHVQIARERGREREREGRNGGRKGKMEVEDERARDGGEGGKQQRQEIHFDGRGGQLRCQRDPGPPARRPTIRRGRGSLPFRRPKGRKKKKTTTTTMEKGKWHAKAEKNFGRRNTKQLFSQTNSKIFEYLGTNTEGFASKGRRDS